MPEASKLYIFEGFSTAEIAYFLLMSQTQVYKTGHRILTQGEVSNGCAYYVNRGVVQVSQGGEVVANLGPGSFFGEIALITDEPRTATVETIEETEIQVFLKDDFLTLLRRSAHSDEMKNEVMHRIAERVNHV